MLVFVDLIKAGAGWAALGRKHSSELREHIRIIFGWANWASGYYRTAELRNYNCVLEFDAKSGQVA